MPDHICPHVSLIKQSHKELFGNGKYGLAKDFIKLQTEVTDMHKDLSSMATSLSALAKSQIEQDATEKEKAKVSERRAKAFEKVGTAFAVVFGLVGILYLVLDHIG